MFDTRNGSWPWFLASFLIYLTLLPACGAPLPEEYGVYLQKGGGYEVIPDEGAGLSSLESSPHPVILIHSKIVTSGREPRDLVQLVGRAYVRASYASPGNPFTLSRIARMDEVRLDQVPLSLRPVPDHPEMIEASVEGDLQPGSYALVVDERSYSFEVFRDGSQQGIDAEDHSTCLDRNGNQYEPCAAVADLVVEWESALENSIATGDFTSGTFSLMKALTAVSPDLRGKGESARHQLLTAVNNATQQEQWRAAIRLTTGALGVWPEDTRLQSLLSDAEAQQGELVRLSQTPSRDAGVFKDLFYQRTWRPTPSGVAVTDVGVRYYGYTAPLERGYLLAWFGDFRPDSRINVSCAGSRSPYDVNIFRRGKSGFSRWQVSFEDRGECDRFVDTLVAAFAAWRNRFAHIPTGFGPEGGLSVRRSGRNPESKYHE